MTLPNFFKNPLYVPPAEPKKEPVMGPVAPSKSSSSSVSSGGTSAASGGMSSGNSSSSSSSGSSSSSSSSSSGPIYSPGVTQNPDTGAVRVTLRPGESSSDKPILDPNGNVVGSQIVITPGVKSAGITPTKQLSSEQVLSEQYKNMDPVARKVREASILVLSGFRPETWWAVASSGGSAKQAAVNVVKSTWSWEANIQQEPNPVLKWGKLQAPTYENVILPLATGGAFKYASAAAKAPGVASSVIRGLQYGSGAVSMGLVGADVGYTAAKSPKYLGPKGLGLVSQFGFMGVGYKENWFSPKEIIEPAYIKNIYGYKPRPSAQINFEESLGTKKYLFTGKEFLELEQSKKLPEIKTTSLDKSFSYEETSKMIVQPKTQQLSMYGSKVYEKPVSIIKSESKVPWKFESMTKQRLLEPTETWTDYRYENGRLVIKEIPRQSVKFFEDTRASQSIIIFGERESRPRFSFESDVFTSMDKPYKPISFKPIPLAYFSPLSSIYGYTRNKDVSSYLTKVSIPSVRQIDLKNISYGEIQSYSKKNDVANVLKDFSSNADKQVSDILSGQKSSQKQRQLQNQFLEQISVSITEMKPKYKSEYMSEKERNLFLGSYQSNSSMNGVVSSSGFDVFVKERSYVHGKKRYPEHWMKVNKTPLSEEAALSLGGTAVDQSAAASFKIRDAGTKAAGKLDIAVDPWGSIVGKFYKKNGIYIESSGGRIDTSGEIKGISALGWIAERRKAMKIPLVSYKPTRELLSQRGFKQPSMMLYKPIDMRTILRGWGL